MDDIAISKFLNFTKSGLQVASYAQIRAALIARYKEVYGSDIDLSTGTADGVFVNDMALIINNILQSVQTLYANLDINSASGIYLDALCALSNVSRKGATYSTASVIVKNIGATDLTNIDELTFIDKAGTEWVFEGNLNLAVGESAEISVKCQTLGAVEAPAGWIYQTVNVTTIQVTQESDAIVGRTEESDAELRARVTGYSASTGLTTIDSLRSALLNVEGVRDVMIWNNNTDKALAPGGSGFSIPAHSVAISIRKDEGITLDDKRIADIIHEKLTPGIRTSEYSEFSFLYLVSSGVGKTYSYIEQVAGQSIQESEQKVYWKEAKPLDCADDEDVYNYYGFETYIKPLDYFTTLTLPLIAQSIMDRLNNLTMGTQLRFGLFDDIVMEAAYLADPKFNRQTTFTVEKFKNFSNFAGVITAFHTSMSYLDLNYSKWEEVMVENESGEQEKQYKITIQNKPFTE